MTVCLYSWKITLRRTGLLLLLVWMTSLAATAQKPATPQASPRPHLPAVEDETSYAKPSALPAVRVVTPSTTLAPTPVPIGRKTTSPEETRKAIWEAFALKDYKRVLALCKELQQESPGDTMAHLYQRMAQDRQAEDQKNLQGKQPYKGLQLLAPAPNKSATAGSTEPLAQAAALSATPAPPTTASKVAAAPATPAAARPAPQAQSTRPLGNKAPRVNASVPPSAPRRIAPRPVVIPQLQPMLSGIKFQYYITGCIVGMLILMILLIFMIRRHAAKKEESGPAPQAGFQRETPPTVFPHKESMAFDVPEEPITDEDLKFDLEPASSFEPFAPAQDDHNLSEEPAPKPLAPAEEPSPFANLFSTDPEDEPTVPAAAMDARPAPVSDSDRFAFEEEESAPPPASAPSAETRIPFKDLMSIDQEEQSPPTPPKPDVEELVFPLLGDLDSVIEHGTAQETGHTDLLQFGPEDQFQPLESEPAEDAAPATPFIPAPEPEPIRFHELETSGPEGVPASPPNGQAADEPKATTPQEEPASPLTIERFVAIKDSDPELAETQPFEPGRFEAFNKPEAESPSEVTRTSWMDQEGGPTFDLPLMDEAEPTGEQTQPPAMRDEFQAFHPDETVPIQVTEEPAEKTLVSQEPTQEPSLADVIDEDDPEAETQVSKQDANGGGVDLFDKEYNKGLSDFETGLWAGAVHHLSIAAALRPDVKEVKETLREARRKRKEELGTHL